MSNPLDTEPGSELFSNYEAELKLVEADLTQKVQQIPELSGEERKQAIRGAERAVDEAKELRYTDDPQDAQLEQRQQLLSGTERLGRSSQRLQESQRIALETEQIGASTLADLHQQRNVLENTHRNLLQSEGYVDRSVKTLRGMARRMATNRLITIAIITVLVLLIIGVIYSKFK
ncbi:hypothetical protein DV735_g46, partial [Chaetothyriales sp. CBS 134920]